MLEHALALVSRQLTAIANWMALIVVTIGMVQAFVTASRLFLQGGGSGSIARTVWLQFSRWLVAGLTFQLAGDVIATAVAPTWEEIGKLAVIAGVRTFLDFFLERDVSEMQTRNEEAPSRQSE